MDLIADIGGTNTRCAIVDDDGNLVATQSFENANFRDLGAVLSQYLDNNNSPGRPERAALAIAAPVRADRVQMVNADWEFSQAELRHALGLSALMVVNDFEALAKGLPSLGDSGLTQIGGGTAVEGAPRAVLGPGTGLGIAALIPAGDGWATVSGEGGHATIAATTDIDNAVVSFIRSDNGHCSAEDLLSGPGLTRIYAALAAIGDETPEYATPAEITAAAQAGDELARATQNVFFSLLGTTAGNLALTVNAFGGVFIGGGIVPRLLTSLMESDFRLRFEDKGDYRDYMKPIPTFVITEPHPAFAGLRAILGSH
ncbi:MAG: glucokinase [Gammaproteobacteria bacterium]